MNRNKNPLNIKQNHGDPWRGSTGADSRGHAVFEDPAYGVRAAMRTMQKKWANGKRDLAAIIADWAPASDTIGSIPGAPANDPAAYARFVARLVGAVPHEILPEPAVNPTLWASILRAMSIYEMGEPAPLSVIMRGVALWLEDFVEGRG